MSITATEALLFKDHTGSLFVLPAAVLERGRVPAERVADVEQLAARSLSDQQDVQGYLTPLAGWLIGCAIGGVLNAAAIGSGAVDYFADYLLSL